MIQPDDFILVPEGGSSAYPDPLIRYQGSSGEVIFSADFALTDKELLETLTGLPFYECCGRFWLYNAWLDHRWWRHGG